MYVFGGPSQEKKLPGGWKGIEQAGSFPKIWGEGTCNFYRFHSLLSPAEVSNIFEHVRDCIEYSSADADTVDGFPTFEHYPFKGGVWQDERMKALLGSIVDERLLPYLRERYSCPECALDTILVRRYVPGERQTHGTHFDTQAMVTAVLGLTDPDDFVGGLYLQPGPHASSRTFFRIDPGDLIVHSFDLQHGVFLWEGIRYSVIFWMKDCPESVREKTSPWYDELAEKDDPDALFNIGQAYEHGRGKELDPVQACRYYKRSASLGHNLAQVSLSKLFMEFYELDAQPSLSESASKLLLQASKRGFATAQKNYAIALANGTCLQENSEEAVFWMRRAAEQLDLEAAYFLGDFYLSGYGMAEDEEEAVKWITRSARAGYPQAQSTLGMLYEEGIGVDQDSQAAQEWLDRAAKQTGGAF
eukprot:TRINITY_DN93788_c0_g1_i1.p1 TRINITY_DN93788_c0_g1~~TRINITY_DN93788_c0_g1_i1.p1  ORF type:complete len:436 (-),score=97.33 TRINITY_DN93788_c0_g1_i1:7-1254(-)